MKRRPSAVRALRTGRVAVAALVAGLAAATAIACGDSASDVPRDVTVEIRNSTYRPSHVRVATGGRVTWINLDEGKSHTAETAHRMEGGFDTHTLRAYEEESAVLDRPGRYEYGSSLDPDMRGVVEVVDPAG